MRRITDAAIHYLVMYRQESSLEHSNLAISMRSANMKTTKMRRKTNPFSTPNDGRPSRTVDQEHRNPSEDDEIERAKQRQRDEELRRQGSKEPA